MKNKLRVLVVGDEKIGKTSLISSHISGYFVDIVPDVIPDTVQNASDNGVTITLMDSSTDQGDQNVLTQKIVLADAIIVLYDVNRPETLGNVANYWLPKIFDIKQDQSSFKTVVVCGTKTDLFKNQKCQLEQENRLLHDILNKYPLVSCGFRCSAKNIDVDSVFNYSEVSTLFPIHDIYDMKVSKFTEKAVLCFFRVFRAFDEDQDGLLNDYELSTLHSKCFNYGSDDELSANDIKALKKQVENHTTINQRVSSVSNKRTSSSSSLAATGRNSNNTSNTPSPVNFIKIKNNGLTFHGFLTMIEIFIESFQPQIPCNILWRCGYDEDLNFIIPTDAMDASLTSQDESSITTTLKKTSHTELSPAAYEYLRRLGISAAAGTLLDHSHYYSSRYNIDNQSLASTEPSHINHNTIDKSSTSGCNLDYESIKNIFSVVADLTLIHPWHPSVMTGFKTESIIRRNIDSANGSESANHDDPYVIFAILSNCCQHTSSPNSSSDITTGDDNSPTTTLISTNASDATTTSSANTTTISSITIEEWLTQWQIFAMYRPKETQILLYYLGFILRTTGQCNDDDEGVNDDFGVMVVGGNRKKNNHDIGDNECEVLKRSCLKVCVLGVNDVDIEKTVFLSALSSLSTDTDTKSSNQSITTVHLSDYKITSDTTISSALNQQQQKQKQFIKVSGCLIPKSDTSSNNSSNKNKTVVNKTRAMLKDSVFMIAEVIPESISEQWIKYHMHKFDVAILMFSIDSSAVATSTSTVSTIDSASATRKSKDAKTSKSSVDNIDKKSNSYTFAATLESLLPSTLPRVSVIATNSSNSASSVNKSSSDVESQQSLSVSVISFTALPNDPSTICSKKLHLDATYSCFLELQQVQLQSSLNINGVEAVKTDSNINSTSSSSSSSSSSSVNKNIVCTTGVRQAQESVLNAVNDSLLDELGLTAYCKQPSLLRKRRWGKNRGGGGGEWSYFYYGFITTVAVVSLGVTGVLVYQHYKDDIRQFIKDKLPRKS